MSDRNDDLDREIKRELKWTTEALFPSDRVKDRIDAAVAAPAFGREGEHSMKKNRVVKVAAIAAACVALSGTTVYAVSQANGWYAYSTPNEYTNYEDLSEAAERAGLTVDLPETFANGYTFREASVQTFGQSDDVGNHLNEYKGVEVYYENGDKEQISVSVEPIVDGQNVGEDAIETREIAPGVTAYYDSHEMLIVPPDYEVSEEDLARQETDSKFWISYGSEEVERKITQHVGFFQDGQKYLMLTFDNPMDADDLFAMASEIAN